MLAPVAMPKVHLADPSRAQVFPGIVSEFGGTNDSIILKGASWGYTTYTSPDPLSNRKKNLVMRQRGLRKNTLANLKHTRSMLESNKFPLSKYFNALKILRAKNELFVIQANCPSNKQLTLDVLRFLEPTRLFHCT